MASSSTGSTPTRKNSAIDFPPASVVDDEAFLTTLANIVSLVYAEAEAGIFVEGYKRTTPSGIAELVRAGQLAVAYDRDPATGSRRPVGCICVKKIDEVAGEFGMLALEASQRGAGVGRDLVLFAEDHCRKLGLTLMRLELLVPQLFEHAFKTRLHQWYGRMGYKMTGVGDFGKDYPQLVPLLVGPTDYKVYEKSLI
ncbi:hypothetical protein F5Y18DRAFT_231885 [Xylariaceae sp. FL1019]|nr:hypothetical protein F5Y18DRAFT_231885 [Xylariaceae sp. FL1019]